MINLNTNLAPTDTLYYNNQKYKVSLVLCNSDGSIFPLSTANLVNLQIVDDGLLWYKTGSIVIRNPDNIIEKRPSAEVSVNANYVFRNDGRDILIVKIIPVLDEEIPSVDLAAELYNLEFVFVIYEKNDIPTGDSTKDRLLQLNFWELDYQIFYETNIDWSKNYVLPANSQLYLLSDEERKVPTGLAIKNLIKYVLGDDTIFTQNWDEGSSKIFYNSLANNNAIDDLNYLLFRHTGKKTGGVQDGDPCLLLRNRYTKVWSLLSFNSIFSDALKGRTEAGPLHIEKFILAGNADSGNNTIPTLPQSPTSSSQIIYSSEINSVINNYQFEDISPDTNVNFFINYPCYSNNLKDKKFVVDFTDNTAESVKNYIQKTYIDKLSVNAAAALTLNNTKKNINIVKQAYSYQNEKVSRFADSRNILIKSMLFLNQALVFTVPGATLRRTNTFIGIDRNQNTIINNFDNKLLGQWFTNKIIHNFTDKEYTTTVFAVKPHTNDRMPISDNVG